MYVAGPNFASGVTFRKYMKLYVCGPHACPEGFIFQAGDQPRKMYVFESFFYVNKWMFPFIDDKVWNFMLDSGAYTFISKSGGYEKLKTATGTVDWDDYVRRYADFIIEHDVAKFLELDIDAVVGLSRVEQLRHMLESRTGLQSIPVWHRSRGLDYWRGMAKDYSYIALGGLAIKTITRSEYKYLNPLCDIAHEQGARVHGLGLSPSSGLLGYRFDSVDSTNWTMGNRAGYVEFFTGSAMRKTDRPKEKQMDARMVALHNLREWLKYQRYMLHAGWSLPTYQDDDD